MNVEHNLANYNINNCLEGGEVLSWGQNKYGQLGLGKSVDLQTEPALVRSLVGVPVIQISAGGAHTLALALPAQVFCCGANSVGQLGLNRTDVKGTVVHFSIYNILSIIPLFQYLLCMWLVKNTWYSIGPAT